MTPPEGSPGPGDRLGGYDSMSAREVMSLLPSLSADERAEVHARERGGKARRSVLARLSELGVAPSARRVDPRALKEA